jgi:hypothetical protein
MIAYKWINSAICFKTKKKTLTLNILFITSGLCKRPFCVYSRRSTIEGEATYQKTSSQKMVLFQLWICLENFHKGRNFGSSWYTSDKRRLIVWIFYRSESRIPFYRSPHVQLDSRASALRTWRTWVWIAPLTCEIDGLAGNWERMLVIHATFLRHYFFKITIADIAAAFVVVVVFVLVAHAILNDLRPFFYCNTTTNKHTICLLPYVPFCNNDVILSSIIPSSSLRLICWCWYKTKWLQKIRMLVSSLSRTGATSKIARATTWIDVRKGYDGRFSGQITSLMSFFWPIECGAFRTKLIVKRGAIVQTASCRHYTTSVWANCTGCGCSDDGLCAMSSWLISSSLSSWTACSDNNNNTLVGPSLFFIKVTLFVSTCQSGISWRTFSCSSAIPPFVRLQSIVSSDPSFNVLPYDSAAEHSWLCEGGVVPWA